ncbi:ribonuclease PH [Candidatus Dependentiae bacterium Noda2021]|nr:ribonuclease PH [Candidatus Dependentiae bacterium Noda2021]
MKGKRTGWLTAEYSMLPTATHVRTMRDESTGKRNGRAIEISRLISRSLRNIVDLSRLGERTITIDCDVLQADGGTRTAAITGSYLALYMATQKWISSGDLDRSFLRDEVAAVSVGVIDGKAYLDLDYQEDSNADADYNFVLTRNGSIVEIQGTCERASISWDNFEHIRQLACLGASEWFKLYDNQKKLIFDVVPQNYSTTKHDDYSSSPAKRAPLFCLKNRLAQ